MASQWMPIHAKEEEVLVHKTSRGIIIYSYPGISFDQTFLFVFLVMILLMPIMMSLDHRFMDCIQLLRGSLMMKERERLSNHRSLIQRISSPDSVLKGVVS